MKVDDTHRDTSFDELSDAMALARFRNELERLRIEIEALRATRSQGTASGLENPGLVRLADNRPIASRPMNERRPR